MHEHRECVVEPPTAHASAYRFMARGRAGEPQPCEVHTLPVLCQTEAETIAADAASTIALIGCTNRGVAMTTDDVLVSDLSTKSQALIYKALHQCIGPYVQSICRRPLLAPAPKNLFIVRYDSRQGCAQLEVHKDGTAMTMNLALTSPSRYVGGGTLFPTATDSLLLRSKPGMCTIHTGEVYHAGNRVTSGTRYILVGFFQARAPARHVIPGRERSLCAAMRDMSWAPTLSWAPVAHATARNGHCAQEMSIPDMIRTRWTPAPAPTCCISPRVVDFPSTEAYQAAVAGKPSRTRSVTNCIGQITDAMRNAQQHVGRP